MHSISKPLLKWFDQFGRHCLPWQAVQDMPNNPYHVWLSEVMLQQTQVATVIDYFNNFIQHFPTLAALANASEDAVLAQWAGLGYYARARNLHTTANIVINQYQGNFPTEFKQVIDLPGIGESTAGAILAISFNQNHAILDGNVKRVLSRYHQVKGHYGQSKTLKELWHLARYHTPNERNADYTQAIMDLGATLCTQRKPDCEQCPIQSDCLAQQTNTQDKYPNPKPRKNKPTRSIAMLIFKDDKHNVYLQKRPNKGVWGGLWSFVECADNGKDIQQAITDFHPSALIEKSLAIFKHSFTHYHLLIHPILIHCLDVKGEFKSLSQLNIGVPKPVNNILRQLD
ncbi:A/G-specific adenine glycosylase [Isorropodon fossajaponicum endosymbiont JTNG4]|uniref:Adenine DNA glycosylase n=1 Tax=Isorropodon fossajaponicum symbiont TaxID=883811 RepID=G1UE66_9GAMM|nr:A/G-specific adenine glycosylase [Isorropodon fossajaponicum symbiont]BAK82153.1 A/G-specific adenine glycosylase [Isorropodon fossajaponicum symbiont]BBB23597.1 A/G-specific adenine glycosylase [Isorropodon fossajaponicum endosymbiont JTNG4]